MAYIVIAYWTQGTIREFASLAVRALEQALCFCVKLNAALLC